MTDRAPVAESLSGRRPLRILWLLLPLMAAAAAFGWLVFGDLLAPFRNGAPPVENLTYERTVLDRSGMHVFVRAGGSEPMRIAQVQVDGAYWSFTQEPPGLLGRGETAGLHIPFPWTLGEAHSIKTVTNTGATFEHTIDVAVPTPRASPTQIRAQAVLGLFVGIVPVALGLLFYPALRGLGRSGMDFLLALTIGLLAFLLIDTAEDALERASEAAAIFQGATMVVLAAATTFLLLMAIGRRHGVPSGIALATYVALGIGLHNLGEGLAIGAAFAAGAAGLGTFLVLGFTLHNITEGIGIAAPMLRSRPTLWTFTALTLLAGGPAVFGIWIGSLAYAPHWSALALAIGAGAILQVIVELTSYLLRKAKAEGGSLTPTGAGLATGVILMYATAMLVKI